MKEIVFISDSEILPELELLRSELRHNNYSLSGGISFPQAVSYLKSNTHKTILINAHLKKLEAYELCRDLKEIFRGAIKVFVFLPQAKANEASKFGFLNAEIEDEHSIGNIINKLPEDNAREYLLEEKVISFHSMMGGLGTSFIAVALAVILEQHKKTSLLLEHTPNLSIKDYLNLDNKLALFAKNKQDNSQNKDLDWLRNFISNNAALERIHYLHLFNSAIEYDQHFLELSEVIEALAKNTQAIDLANIEQAEKQVLRISNSLELIKKELNGNSYSLFEELIQLGTQLSQHLLFDLGSNISSAVSRQLLRLSNRLVLVFKDTTHIGHKYKTYKQYLETEFKLKVIPVLVTQEHNHQHYQKFTEKDWKESLGEVPLLYPYEIETLHRFKNIQNNINQESKIYKFAEELALNCSIELEADTSTKKQHSLLSFLSNNIK